jgi:thioredoxin 1
MLYTNLNHIESAAEYAKIISSYNNVVVICGRMGNKCIPVYRIAEALEPQYKHVKFFDMEFDNPESNILRNVIEYYDLKNLPLVVYIKTGNLVEATFGKQTIEKITAILKKEFTQKILC